MKVHNINTHLFLKSLLIFLYFFHQILAKKVSISYDLYFGGITIFVEMGSTNAYSLFSVDTEAKFSRISEYIFNKTQVDSATRKSFGDKAIKIKNEKIFGELFEDSLQVGENAFLMGEKVKVSNFHFMKIYDKYKKIDSLTSLAFAYNVEEENFSIMHLLKKNKLINKMQFAIEKSKDNDEKGNIYIDEIADKFIDGKSQYDINIITKNGLWEIPLTHIIFGQISYVYNNDFYKNQNNAILSTNQKYIIAPPDFYQEIIIKKYFFNALMNKDCQLKNYGSFEISCDCDAIKNTKFEPINFIIDGIAFEFKPEKMFEKFEGVCIFSVHQNQRGNDWKFGLNFIGKYFTVFNYEDAKVTFYSDTKLEYINLNRLFPKSRTYILFVILAIVIVLIVAFFAYRKFKKSRKSNRMNQAVKKVYQSME